MNNYLVAKCPHCKKPFEVDTGIRVHGSRNANVAREKLASRETVDVAKEFCRYCQGAIPCGCGHTDPQSGYMPR